VIEIAMADAGFFWSEDAEPGGRCVTGAEEACVYEI
jgi:hypothetical protein